VKFPFSAIAAAIRERRAVHQQIPDVTMNDVERIVRRDFPKGQFDLVTSALEELHSKTYPGTRVQLAVLKLTNGNLESLKNQVSIAMRDYRDVLLAAEYPEYMKAGLFRVRKLSRKEQQRIVDADWNQSISGMAAEIGSAEIQFVNFGA
jgi:hypothetical protein